MRSSIRLLTSGLALAACCWSASTLAALHALQELHADGSLTLYGADAVQRDAAGKLSI